MRSTDGNDWDDQETALIVPVPPLNCMDILKHGQRGSRAIGLLG
jgi:hypothetical protein